MPQLSVRDAAALLGVSDDTIRRLIDTGTLTAGTGANGRRAVDGLQLAMVARSQAAAAAPSEAVGSSARNRFVGLVTAITVDAVMAQVELQCGPYRVVSLLSAEAVADLGLELGAVATAVIKSTNVIVETDRTAQ